MIRETIIFTLIDCPDIVKSYYETCTSLVSFRSFSFTEHGKTIPRSEIRGNFVLPRKQIHRSTDATVMSGVASKLIAAFQQLRSFVTFLLTRDARGPIVRATHDFTQRNLFPSRDWRFRVETRRKFRSDCCNGGTKSSRRKVNCHFNLEFDKPIKFRALFRANFPRVSTRERRSLLSRRFV